MSWITDPLSTEFMLRALLGGLLVAVICAIAGTWVIVRGMAFLGEAMAHGTLPGVALATLAGVPPIAGAAVSAAAMSIGVSALQRRGRLSYDTSIGLLFVAMLALGVIVISHSRSFATDATAILFGDILAISWADIGLLALALAVTTGIALGLHRSLVALAFDERIAHTLGLRPRLAQAALVTLVTLAVVASYQAVGSLLVVGLLLAPAVAAGPWTVRIPATMALASLIGSLAVLIGILLSWHAGTAAGASIAASTIAAAGLSALIRRGTRGMRRMRSAPPKPGRRGGIGALATTLLLSAAITGCAAGPTTADAAEDATDSGDGHGAVEGAAEVAEPPLHLAVIDPAGAVAQLDLLEGSWTTIGELEHPALVVASDGRYLFALGDGTVEIVDSGMWTWDHIDHFHYYRASPRLIGTIQNEGTARVVTGAHATSGGTGVHFPASGDAVLLDNAALAKGRIVESFRLDGTPHAGLVVPLGSIALVTEADTDDGAATRVRAHTADGAAIDGAVAECRAAQGAIVTRVGAAIGCEDGALLVTLEGEGPVFERIPYPAGTTAARVASFDNRKGRPTVAALAGEAGTDGIWLLDTRARRWSLLPSPAPLLAVTAVDDADGHVLALDTIGRVHVIDGTSGAALATTEPLLPQTLQAPDALAGVTLTVDQQRAYLNAPLEQRLYEIDYADGARIARSFDTAEPPMHAVETGR